MESEIQTQLENIVKAIEKLDRPDWWSIGIASAIALVNAGFMIWIGIRQNKLQQQQNKQQKYEVYKKMFSVVEDANDVAIKLLNFIYRYFSNSNARKIDENTLVYLQGEIKEIERELKDSRADFKLKFLQGNYQAECYIEFLKEMRTITQLFIYLESIGSIEFIKHICKVLDAIVRL